MGVQGEVITAGNGGKPIRGQRASVHYIGTLASDGKQFDSSRGMGQPYSWTLGVNPVIKGLDVGVAQMNQGEHAILRVTPDYAFGSQGVGDLVPLNADVVFEVELLSFE